MVTSVLIVPYKYSITTATATAELSVVNNKLLVILDQILI